jgi:hypothetical protein
MSTDRDCQGKPGSSILSMDNQCGWVTLISINKQNDHLAITIIGSMVWAGTVGVSQAGHLQIKRLHDAEASTDQLSVDPGLNLLAGLIENQKWYQSTHFVLPVVSSIDGRLLKP